MLIGLLHVFMFLYNSTITMTHLWIKNNEESVYLHVPPKISVNMSIIMIHVRYILWLFFFLTTMNVFSNIEKIITMDSYVFSSLTTLSLSLSYLNSTCNLIQSWVQVLYILHVTNMYFSLLVSHKHHYRRRNDVWFILSSNFVHVWIKFLNAGQRGCVQCLYYWQGPVLSDVFPF